MKLDYLLLTSVLLLFAMLWLPLGQYDFLLDHWMKIGTYAVPFLLMGTYSFVQNSPSKPHFTNIRFISILLLIAYILHQYEEHWIDLFGNYYAFYHFNNSFILNALGATDDSVKPLTPASSFVINTSLVWLEGAMAIVRSPQHLFPAIAMASITVFNGAVHILAAVANWQYNPGLVTSIVIFIPLYYWLVRSILAASAVAKKQLIVGMIWAFLAHVIMVAGLLMANWFKLFPEMLYFAVLVLWSLVPTFLFRKTKA